MLLPSLGSCWSVLQGRHAEAQAPDCRFAECADVIPHHCGCGLPCCSQGFIDGIGPMASLPRPLAAAGVWVLRTEQLRMVSLRLHTCCFRMAFA